MHTKDFSTWPADSAGHHMMSNVPFARPDQTLGEVQKELHASMTAHETINYIYVLDEEKKLVGVLSIKDLYRHTLATKVKSVCKKEFVTVKPATHQERVAYLALKHNIKSVPVVDHEGVFLGIIPSDTILTILYKETHEDLLRMSGVHHHKSLFDNVLTLTLWQSIKHRIPWLFIGLLGGIGAAKVVGAFEDILAEHIVLAAFIPLIVYMSGAIGAQMGAFMIRDLAINHQIPFLKYFMRQLIIITCIGICFAFLLFGASMIFYGHLQVSAVLGVSLFAAIVSSVFTGLIIPQFFSALKMDPANGSGPIATIIQDILSIIIYLSVATVLL